MKRRQVAVCCSVVILALSGSAHAVITISPPVRNSEGDNLGCVLQNVSAQAVEVESELNNGLGTIVDTQTLTVPAGQALLLARSTTAVFGAYCVFEFQGNATEVRGYIRLEDAGGSNTRLLYPARPVDDAADQLQVDVFSPPVRNSEGQNLGCVAQNVSTADVQIISELNNGLGTIVDDQTLTVPAGQALLLARSSDAVFGAYCHFRFSGNPSRVRGFIRLEDAGGSNTRLLFPAEQAIAAIPPPSTATPTNTASVPFPTPTATVPDNQTPGPCCGDCNGDNEVRVDELVSAVNRALGGCPE